MKRNTCPTLTNAAAPAARSKRYLFSTERTRALLEAGRGIATAFSAEDLHVESMGRHPKTPATPDFESGGKTIPRRQRAWTRSAALSRNMDYRPMRLRPCDPHKAGGAQSVSDRPVACLSITAIRKGTSGRCYARPAIPFSAGMNGKPALCSSSSNTWKSTAVRLDQPCHADVLLEIANGVDS